MQSSRETDSDASHPPQPDAQAERVGSAREPPERGNGGAETGGVDVFVNAVGGVRINEPAADLAILLAVHSSLIGRPLPAKTLIFGEVGLAGEVRPVQGGQDRIKEAAKLGFRQFLIPTLNKPKQPIDNTKLITVDRVDQAVRLLRN